jgi:myo-inositol-1(or 4)-monophosphatase
MSTARYKNVIIAAMRKAGQALQTRYQNFNRSTARLKSAHEIVTAGDLESERIIMSAIQKNFPDHQILSEESGENGERSDYLWIIDPLDGTTNFSMHNPLWSISVGLAMKGEIILGVVYAPVLGELFVAEKEKGVTLNGKKIKVSLINSGKVINTFCHGSNEADIKRAVQYYTKQKLKQMDCRQLGSAALELAYVAAGRVESIVIPGANAWDVAAGVLIVREAGGVVTDFFGHNWNLNSKDIAASNGIMQEEILRMVG